MTEKPPPDLPDGVRYSMRFDEAGKMIEYTRPGSPPMQWSAPPPSVADPCGEVDWPEAGVPPPGWQWTHAEDFTTPETRSYGKLYPRIDARLEVAPRAHGGYKVEWLYWPAAPEPEPQRTPWWAVAVGWVVGLGVFIGGFWWAIVGGLVRSIAEVPGEAAGEGGVVGPIVAGVWMVVSAGAGMLAAFLASLLQRRR